jgi:hypothetical protein
VEDLRARRVEQLQASLASRGVLRSSERVRGEIGIGQQAMQQKLQGQLALGNLADVQQDMGSALALYGLQQRQAQYQDVQSSAFGQALGGMLAQGVLGGGFRSGNLFGGRGVQRYNSSGGGSTMAMPSYQPSAYDLTPFRGGRA